MHPAVPSIPHTSLLGRMGALSVRLADGEDDVARALALRATVFGRAQDGDAFDAACDHVIVEDGGAVVATYRLLPQDGRRSSYVASEFDVATLYARHPDRRFLELGRSCVAPAHRSKRVMELLWHGTWAYVVRNNFDVLLGCASLPGTVPDAAALAFLRETARAPEGWRVQAMQGRGVAMMGEPLAPRDAMRRLPPLIKGYLRLGAWVGEEAVVDPDFGTTDVLIVLDRTAISQRYLDHFGVRAERYAC